MPPLDEFDRVLELLESASDDHLFVGLAQFGTRWAGDGAAKKLRDRIDDAVLERFLCRPTTLRVRRLVLYDLPERGQEGSPDENHARWVARLRRDLAYLDAGPPSSPVSYEIQLHVLGTGDRAPADVVALDPHDQAFEDLWKPSVQFRLTAGEVNTTAPYPDFDPLYYMDFDVADADRHQFSAGRRERWASPQQRRTWLPWRS
jgi:hypothetical protein